MTTESKMHFLQEFETCDIHRSKISEAAYNPREMPEQHYNDLKRSLKKIKLREPLVWNEFTGNLVGGHQRLRILDETWKRKNDNLDYTITVAVVRLELKEEIELNIALNNPRLMGDYDISKMNEILSSDTFPDLDLDVAGIKDEDLQMFGIELDLGTMDNDSIMDVINSFEDVKEQKKADVSPEERQLKKEAVQAQKKEQIKNEVDTYVTISFSNQSDKRAFMKKIGEQEASLYIKGEVFVSKFFKE